MTHCGYFPKEELAAITRCRNTAPGSPWPNNARCIEGQLAGFTTEDVFSIACGLPNRATQVRSCPPTAQSKGSGCSSGLGDSALDKSTKGARPRRRRHPEQRMPGEGPTCQRARGVRDFRGGFRPQDEQPGRREGRLPCSLVCDHRVRWAASIDHVQAMP